MKKVPENERIFDPQKGAFQPAIFRAYVSLQGGYVMLVFESHEQHGFDITVFAAYRKSRYQSQMFYIGY